MSQGPDRHSAIDRAAVRRDRIQAGYLILQFAALAVLILGVILLIMAGLYLHGAMTENARAIRENNQRIQNMEGTLKKIDS